MRILLAEDDESLGSGLVEGLRRLGYTVDWVKDGAETWQAVQHSDAIDALVLDIGLPRVDGFSLLQQLRERQNDMPVLILTARDSVDDRVRGLDIGADDYLVKPFDLNELSARLRAISRRREGRRALTLVHGAIELDPGTRQVSVEGRPVNLSGHEFALLELLLSQAGRIVSRERMGEALYGWEDGVESNALEVHIHHLRRKLGDKGLIRTIRGVGYQLAASDRA
jgi:two-component system, OmpR family, response regulator QseB